MGVRQGRHVALYPRMRLHAGLTARSAHPTQTATQAAVIDRTSLGKQREHAMEATGTSLFVAVVSTKWTHS
jgi:hypothetical protein